MYICFMMTDVKSIWYLVKKDFKIDFRQGYAISSVLLFVFTCVFIVYKSFTEFSPQSWIVIFFIILLFVSINAVLKSFMQESGDASLYYYSLLNPLHVIIAKTIYNFVFILSLSMVIWMLLIFFSFNPFVDSFNFFLVLVFVAYGFSVVFTFVSGLSKADGVNATLLAVLGMPLVLPIILLGIKISFSSTSLLSDTSLGTDFSLLGGIDLLLTGISVILFSILWKS